MEAPTHIILLIGRFFLGGLFVIVGVRHLLGLDRVIARMTLRGLPLAHVFVTIGTIFQVVAGLCVMAGLLVAPAALSLVAFTLVASFLALDFWNKPFNERSAAIREWQSNIAIIGGLLTIAAR